MNSAIQNTRNIRVQIPKRCARMLVDLATRNFDKDLFIKVCETIFKSLDLELHNSTRILKAIISVCQKEMKVEYQDIVY